MTPAEFKVRKPQFVAVADPTVQTYLDMAARAVDPASWFAADVDSGQAAFACHLMTLDGLGTDAASRAHATGTAEFQMIRSGQLTLQRYARAGDGTRYSDWLNSTPCGRNYGILARMNVGGPRVATVGCIPGSGYAKDVPYGWPGFFG